LSRYRGLGDCLVAIVREEGVWALYKGLVPRVSQIALGGAIFFGAYEAVKARADHLLITGELDGFLKPFRRGAAAEPAKAK
jgi:hypothetical protein